MEKQVILPMEQYDAIMKALDTNLKENVVSFTREEYGQQNVYLNYILSKDEAVKELTEELEEIRPRYEECIKHNTKLLEEELRLIERLQELSKEKMYYKDMFNEELDKNIKNAASETTIDNLTAKLQTVHEGRAKTNKQLAKAKAAIVLLVGISLLLAVYIIIAMINQA